MSSKRTTSASSTSTPASNGQLPAKPSPEQEAAFKAQLRGNIAGNIRAILASEGLPLWDEATQEQQAVIVEGYRDCLEEGGNEADILACMRSHTGTTAEFLAMAVRVTEEQDRASRSETVRGGVEAQLQVEAQLDQPPTTEQRVANQEARIATEEADRAGTMPEWAMEWAATHYQDIPGEAVDVAEQAVAFHAEFGYQPRNEAELDAWSNSPEEWAAYQLANPAPTLSEAQPSPDAKAAQVEQARAAAEAAVLANATSQASPDQAQAIVERLAESRAKEAVDQEELEAQASATLKALVKAFRRGEQEYSRGLLEAGELCQEYVVQRVEMVGDKPAARKAAREAAVKVIEGRLAEYASDSPDVNRLIRCWAAYSLLSKASGLDVPQDGKGKPPADLVPYGHYRDAWCLVVQREGINTPEERHTLLPLVGAECASEYKAAVLGNMAKGVAIAKAQELVRESLQRQKQAAAKAAHEAQQQDAAAKEADRQAVLGRQKAELAKAKVAQEAKAQEDAAKAKGEELSAEQRAEQTAKLEQARADAEAAALREKDTQAKATKAAADKVAADKAEAEAKRLADIQAVKDAKARTCKGCDTVMPDATDLTKGKCAACRAKETTKPSSPTADPTKAPESRGVNVLASLASSAKLNPKDTATMMASAVHKVDDIPAICHDLAIALAKVPEAIPDCYPDDVVVSMLKGFLASQDVTLPAKRHLAACLAAMTAKASPSPVDVANALIAAKVTSPSSPLPANVA